MYDSIKLHEPFEMDNSIKLPSIVKWLTNPLQHQSPDGQIFYTGTTLGMKVNISNNHFRINGSLCKSYHGNNLKSLTSRETKWAIEKLSDSIHYDIRNFHTTNIDIAYNLEVNYPVEYYYPILGPLRKFERWTRSHSLYYSNKSKTICFYNKIEEAIAKKMHPPPEFLNKNLLRVEMRLGSRLTRQLNKGPVYLWKLQSQDFLCQLVDILLKDYQLIQKNNSITYNPKPMTKNEFMEYLAALYINQQGQNFIYEMINTLPFANNRAKLRSKAAIKNLPFLSQESDLVMELDEKISGIKDKVE